MDNESEITLEANSNVEIVNMDELIVEICYRIVLKLLLSVKEGC